MNNTQSPPAWTSPSPPPGCTHSEQSTMLLQLPPSKPHAPTNRTVHTYPRYTQTYPNKLTRLYIQTPSHYRQTDKQTDRQTDRQPDSQAYSHTYKNIRACFNTRCYILPSANPTPTQNVQYTVRKQSQATTLPQCCQPVCACVCVCIYVCQSVCQSVSQCMGGWVSEIMIDFLKK